MKILYSYLAAIILVLPNLACKDSSNPVIKASSRLRSLNLAGRVYDYAPEIDSANSGVIGYCDCCSGSILFLDSVRYISIDQCEMNETIEYGKYRVTDTGVVLTLPNKIVLKEYNPERESDSNAKPDYFIKVETSKSVELLLKPLVFKNVVFFTFNDGDFFYCAPDKSTTSASAKIIANLKEDGIWDKLMATGH